MLDNVKACIEQTKQDDTSFDTFFQEYIMTMQDSIINKQIQSITRQIHNVEQISSIEEKITELQYEL